MSEKLTPMGWEEIGLPEKKPHGWPVTAACECNGKLVLLTASYVLARYQCQDGCRRMFKVFR